mmetsp:Transcript_39901/g.123298  ORF Transcript_39901/g.123298 Transcript_39901/m.123298 type:complete len:213 (-) Transcript_39901:19-657(-)
MLRPRVAQQRRQLALLAGEVLRLLAAGGRRGLSGFGRGHDAGGADEVGLLGRGAGPQRRLRDLFDLPAEPQRLRRVALGDGLRRLGQGLALLLQDVLRVARAPLPVVALAVRALPYGRLLRLANDGAFGQHVFRDGGEGERGLVELLFEAARLGVFGPVLQQPAHLLVHLAVVRLGDEAPRCLLAQRHGGFSGGWKGRKTGVEMERMRSRGQ